MKRLVLLLLVLAVAACSIKQEIKPLKLADLSAKEICIRDNPEVRPGFIEAYRSRLEAKGFKVTILGREAPVSSCPLTSTYTANWRWDLLLYLAYAEILVYRDGQVVGRALYDSLGGGGRIIDKFVNATTKINELVDQLFPG